MTDLKTIRIGTRGSPLALTQTRAVCAALESAHADVKTQITIIKTSGDWTPADGETRLSEAEGGKGLFAKEIEAAMLAGDIDAGVHSMKDMDSNLPAGLVINHMMPREDARDALLLSPALKEKLEQNPADPLAALPHGAIIGTASVRRAAFLLNRRPDLKTVPLRGNVQTRIDKLATGQVDATLLAMAGLNRLELSHHADIILPPEILLPAAGQGAVGIEMREEDSWLADLFDAISCRQTLLRVKAERAALKTLDGSCRSPIAAHATLENEKMHLNLAVADMEGTHIFAEEKMALVKNVRDAETLGRECAEIIKSQIPPGFVST
ncbi:MAG: hydroxymethylbilane synthase [Alphaproteobacteria bacterium]|nr:hydroxymethylbilane synthase [Alphaproteobacteria bacterium]